MGAILAFGVLLTPLNIFNKPSMRPNTVQSAIDQSYIEALAQSVKDNNMQIVVTPESLMGLHLDELFKIVISDALENHTLHELPQGVLTCYEMLENGARVLNVMDLAKALPVVVERLSAMLKEDRAPRPDAPGNTDGSPVGALLECDFTPVLQLLNRLIQIVTQCCAILQQDFQFTWTILADIKSTITTDFNGTFTVLSDINDTLTTCCANIQTDFNGVFTVLTDIKSTITNDFNGTFTFLNEINNTLTTCCANIQTDFNGVFTVLDEINTTLTSCCATIQNDFIGVFTSIAAIDVDFNSVFTAIADVKSSLTTCCADIQIDFNGVFTAIAHISTGSACDLTGIFTSLTEINTTLTTCCANIQVDFNGVFTSLANVNCDLVGVYTVLNDVFITLTSCTCSVLGTLSNNPPPIPNLPDALDVYSTTTFDVIQWLKAIYIQLHLLSFGD